jgi:hypothetical protein
MLIQAALIRDYEGLFFDLLPVVRERRFRNLWMPEVGRDLPVMPRPEWPLTLY